ncbi:XRE family transcriptional regulator [Streptomyces sp. BE147]|uniref:XRE family transcriptional regulator n=1 Tax=Streptomyces sp. BE147 TaxID=3002524 RepID=UPI002E7A8C84|nr:XRE family transcriptional regulator [Streptomyces sp. BE147]MEE1735337.1 XRE family transcriptional regulator [Streptomyces sp. BE147]
MDEDERTPHPLAALRIALGFTRVEFAEAVHGAARRRGLRSGIDKARVRKWEVNGVRPDAVSQTYIAEVLGIPAGDVNPAAWPAWLPSVDRGVVPLGHANTVPALREALRTMDRRTLLSAIPGSALIVLAGSRAGTEPTALAAGPPRPGAEVCEDVVALLEETSARLNVLATEQRQHIAPLYDAHLARVTDLIDEQRYSRPLGARLHKLAASLSQTAAWIRFDHGQHGSASRYWIAGLHNAHAGDDRDMGAAILSDLAYQASWRDDPTTAAGILTKALRRTTHPAASSLLHLRLARAQAALGERRASLHSLNTAERLLGAGNAGDVPAWCSWMSHADLAVDSGRCLFDLGDTTQAHRLIAEGQALLPASRDKTRGIFLAYRAQGHLSRREPEAAAADALEALHLAERIGAPRCVQLVRELAPIFTSYRTADGVPELLHAVA